MVPALLGVGLSAALCALCERSELSLGASIAGLWLALAPLVVAGGRRSSAALATACAAPFLCVAASADVSAGAAWSAALWTVAVSALWIAALAAAAASAHARGVQTRWLGTWLALSLAAPLGSLALALGGDGAQAPWLRWMESASVLSWCGRQLALVAGEPLSWGAAIGAAAPPTLALLAAAWWARGTRASQEPSDGR